MQPTPSQTPLSNLMEAYFTSRDPQSYRRFLRALSSARVGVIAGGAADEILGDVESTAEHPLWIGRAEDTEGHPVALAFADPVAFERRFGSMFNAEMVGEDVLRTVVSSPDCHGVCVNSALAEVSIIIPRDVATLLLGGNG